MVQVDRGKIFDRFGNHSVRNYVMYPTLIFTEFADLHRFCRNWCILVKLDVISANRQNRLFDLLDSHKMMLRKSTENTFSADMDLA